MCIRDRPDAVQAKSQMYSAGSETFQRIPTCTLQLAVGGTVSGSIFLASLLEENTQNGPQICL